MATNSSRKVKKYLEHQLSMDTLRFITCGSVDDGKSTLIGRLLFETGSVFDDQLESLRNDSVKMGTQGGDIDYALLVDGLSAEREQGITIDVAYRFFSTPKRKFIVADTPGHEQYTRNMATGASTADAALILIDAQKGISNQTKRHSIICSYLGVKHAAVILNKMDLVDYSEMAFKQISKEYSEFIQPLNFQSAITIPASALNGENLVTRSENMSWYKGPTIIELLDNIEVQTEKKSDQFRMPVQWVNRPNSDFRGFSGIIESGSISLGDPVKVVPSNEVALIKEIVALNGNLDCAQSPSAITVTLDKEIDASRGDWLVAETANPNVADQFEADIVWMSRDKGFSGRRYWLKIGTLQVSAQITKIKYKVNVESLNKTTTDSLGLNDLAVVTVKTDREIPFENYAAIRRLGAFILIDRTDYQTVSAGMIKHALRRASNVIEQKHDIDKNARRALNQHTSKVVWLTGLSGSGKSSIANSLERELYDRGVRSYILDGDNIRGGLNNDLGFTEADRIENVRRVAEVSKLMVDAGLIVITALISPFKNERQLARDVFEEGEFLEVFVDTPLRVAEKRDVKGLYKKARRGDIPNFTGIGSPYETPENPDLRLDTTKMTLQQEVEEILKLLDLDAIHQY